MIYNFSIRFFTNQLLVVSLCFVLFYYFSQTKPTTLMDWSVHFFLWFLKCTCLKSWKRVVVCYMHIIAYNRNQLSQIFRYFLLNFRRILLKSEVKTCFLFHCCEQQIDHVSNCFNQINGDKYHFNNLTADNSDNSDNSRFPSWKNALPEESPRQSSRTNMFWFKDDFIKCFS